MLDHLSGHMKMSWRGYHKGKTCCEASEMVWVVSAKSKNQENVSGNDEKETDSEDFKNRIKRTLLLSNFEERVGQEGS